MRRSASIFLVAVGFLLVTACTSISEAPDEADFVPLVTFGTPDGNAHQHVGTLIFSQGGSFYSCTGTLLSSTLMLTAGHCVEEGGAFNEVTYVSFDPEPMADRGVQEDGGPEPLLDYLERAWIRASEVVAHPGYADFAEWPNTFDIGLVMLSEPVELDAYGELPELGLLERLAGAGRQERLFTAVGYGLQGHVPAFFQRDYVRYRGETSLIEVVSAFNGDEQGAKFSNSPGGGNGSGGVCFGDSGGPVFHGDSNVVGAIVSWGITPCIGVDYQFRVDTAVAQDFVRPYLEAMQGAADGKKRGGKGR